MRDSTEPAANQPGEPPQLFDWIAGLVAKLAAEPAALARLQAVVGDRRARITLDDETTIVAMADGRVVPVLNDGAPVDGAATATRGAVLALLDGRLDATDALRCGYITAIGEVDNATAMLHAIEILIDAATRNPTLRALADAYRAAGSDEGIPGTGISDELVRNEELALLRRLGLADEAQ